MTEIVQSPQPAFVDAGRFTRLRSQTMLNRRPVRISAYTKTPEDATLKLFVYRADNHSFLPDTSRRFPSPMRNQQVRTPDSDSRV